MSGSLGGFLACSAFTLDRVRDKDVGDHVTPLITVWILTCCYFTVEAQDPQKDFEVECIRPLGIRVTPSADFRVIQTGCRGQEINVPLEPPYDVTPDCLVVTATGTAVQVILEESTSTNNLVGGFSSRVFLVSCDFPGSKGYKDTFNRDIEAIKQPAGLDPTATSGVFKFTGILMSIINKASFTARRWAEHLVSNAFIGQELYLTISHPQKDEGQAFIIPRTCRIRPDTGNFTTIWHHASTQQRCLEVSGISRDPVRVFSDVSTATDVMSLQFYGFQFLGHEEEVITFECDVLLCGDITTGSCGQEWTKLTVEKVCMTNKLPPVPRPRPTNPSGKQRRRRRRRRRKRRQASTASADSIIDNSIYSNLNGLFRSRRQALDRSNSNIGSNNTDIVNNRGSNQINVDGNDDTYSKDYNSNNDRSRENNTRGNNNNSPTIATQTNKNTSRKNSINDSSKQNDRNLILTGMPSTSPSSSSITTDSNIYSSNSRTAVQEETVRVEIRMMMPRAKLTYIGSDMRIQSFDTDCLVT
ncbi:hypothetical protein PoB_006606700 [Plakobranchus ocellatus]|uniref:ZP domain-containing protein n=1 Tax=Plakobranchus ocellatus TaxID=259542 RepID=A0AAV4D5Z5_9GAST|nr:hypothetical protein PoB_006606700 [Plakobranchus ocellatus]